MKIAQTHVIMRTNILTIASALLLAVGLPAPTSAQEVPITIDVPLPPGVTYDPAIPTPQEVLGHVIGQRHTMPHEVVRYFEAVAEASDRVQLAEHGRTHEGRKLIHAFVSTPDKLARLEEIRRANLRLSDAAGDVSDAELADMPAIALMGYSIHGNEASGTEAALLTLYHLAAGRGEAVESVLESAVVIVDPMFNPDGRDRFTDWANRNRGAIASTDPQGREHNEPWPGGRTNHYWFDLNRDWLPLVHPTSQGRVALYHQWRPQVLTDYHEMGSDDTYFFMPGIQSRVNPETPLRNQELTADIAAYHAEYLDRIGSLYFSEEGYDDFYVGKGSTFPDVQGTIGILFEQASSRALERETVNGVLTFAFTVRNHFMASLSTLNAVVDMREELLRYQRDFYAGASQAAAEKESRGWVVATDTRPVRAALLGQLLQSHRVRLHELGQEVTVDGRTFQPGSAWVVSVDQPQGRLVSAAMERVTTFTDSLFYDVSTWTLPLAYDVDHGVLTSDPSGLLGAELGPLTPPAGELVGGEASYAYLMEWGTYFAPRALHRLQAAGILPRLATRGFGAEVAGQVVDFEPGTIIIPVTQAEVDAATVHEVVAEAAARDHVRVHATRTGFTARGNDIGGRSNEPLALPRVALLTGEGTSSYDAGEAWHLLNERMHMPITLLDAAEVAGADLDRYNVILLAGGGYGNVPADKLRTWVAEGGTLIGMESGAEWIVETGMIPLEERTLDVDSLLVGKQWADLDDAYGAHGIGGSIFHAELDPTHPLSFGIGSDLPVFRQGTTLYDAPTTPGMTVARYAEEPLLSGYISEERLELMPGAAVVVADEMGSGSVIALMDDADFRGFWYGSAQLLLNAVFFGASF